jgi:hypothetical protein
VEATARMQTSTTNPLARCKSGREAPIPSPRDRDTKEALAMILLPKYLNQHRARRQSWHAAITTTFRQRLH